MVAGEFISHPDFGHRADEILADGSGSSSGGQGDVQGSFTGELRGLGMMEWRLRRSG